MRLWPFSFLLTYRTTGPWRFAAGKNTQRWINIIPWQMRVVTTPTYPYGMAILTMHEVGIYYYSFGSCCSAKLHGGVAWKYSLQASLKCLHEYLAWLQSCPSRHFTHTDTDLYWLSIHVLAVNQGWLCENTSDLFHNISPCLFQLDLFPIEFTCCGIFIRR